MSAPTLEESVEKKPPEASPGGLSKLWDNVKKLPRHAWQSMIRHGAPRSPRTRSQTVFSNFYLHIHSVRTHRWTLKKSFTLGLGVMTAFLFCLLTVTGALLMLYFKPTVAEAYNSVKDIHNVVPGGRILRNIHRWGGHMMVVCVILHMARVFFTRSYQRPRELNWLIGVFLLVLTFALAFTGYCLPWDQLGYWATRIGSEIAGSPRELTDALGITESFDPGSFQKQALLGARTVGGETILRMYWLHCIAIPLAAIALMALHFWRIRKDGGISRPEVIEDAELAGIPREKVAQEAFESKGRAYTVACVVHGTSLAVGKGPDNTVQSLPHAFRAELAVCMGVLAFLLLLGLCFDAPLKQPANPNVPENPAKAPWYFLGFQELVSYSAFVGGLAVPGLVVIGLALIPFLDREKGTAGRWPRGREPRWMGISAALTAMAILGLLAIRINFGWLRAWLDDPELEQIWVILINPGTILLGLIFAFTLFSIKKTGSTRIGMLSFFTAFLVAYVILTYFGTVHRGPNWDFYWWPSAWPTH